MAMTEDEQDRWWWEQEMGAFDARLAALLKHFYRTLDVADGDLDAVNALREIGDISWAIEADRMLIEVLVTEWLGAVKKNVFRRKIAKARPDQMQKLVTEEVVAMRPLSHTERDELWNSLADTGSPMSLIKLRLATLYEFHVQFLRTVEALPDQDKEAETRFRKSGGISGPQEKEAKRRFPKALVEDRKQLNAWVLWRGLVKAAFVEPRLQTIRARGGFADIEEIRQFFKELAGE